MNKAVKRTIRQHDNKRNVAFICSWNSEAGASEFQENMKKMFAENENSEAAQPDSNQSRTARLTKDQEINSSHSRRSMSCLTLYIRATVITTFITSTVMFI